MITAVTHVPGDGRKRSAVRQFANETLLELSESDTGAYEVTGWPDGKTAEQVANALRNEAWTLGISGSVRISQRGKRLFVTYGKRGRGGPKSTALDPDKLYSARDVEGALGLQHGTVVAAVRDGSLMVTRLGGKQNRYRGRDVMDWVRCGGVTGVRA